MTRAKRAKAVLASMRELLASEDAWCQGDIAQNASGEPCLPGDPDACRWCLMGAIDRAGLTIENPPINLVLTFLGLEWLPRHNHHNHGVIGWNDAPGRTHAEVLALINRAGRRRRSVKENSHRR